MPSGRAFFLSAALYTNANGIIDDDIYEYDLADVYLADLGEVLARTALSIPLEQAPLTEPKEDCTPSSHWPKPLYEKANSDGLIPRREQYIDEESKMDMKEESKMESLVVNY